MQVCKWARKAVVGMAVSGLFLPAPFVFGESPGTEDTTPKGTVLPEVKTKSPDVLGQAIDVTLSEGGVLRGFVVDNAGKRTAGVHVLMFQQQRLVAEGQSNEDGQFAIARVRGGIYQLVIGERVVSVRCWSPAAAPPSSLKSALIQITDVHRGQVHPATCAMANPWIIAGIAAAAVIVPVSLKTNRDARPLGSG